MTNKVRALLVVDCQNDFVEGGSLAVTGGKAVVSAIADLLHEHRYLYVAATRDWHEPPPSTNYGHFAKPGIDPDYSKSWPVHCVQHSEGSQFAEPLKESLFDAIFDKGMGKPALSGFINLDLRDWLQMNRVTEIDVCGLAADYCVIATAVDGVKNGYKTSILWDYTAAVAPDGMTKAKDELDRVSA